MSRESVAAVSRQCRSRAGLPEEVEKLAPIFRAELQAYQGKYQDAARAFAKAGEPQKAIDLFAVLTQRLFPNFSELQGRVDGVNAMPPVIESTCLVNDAVVPRRRRHDAQDLR